MANGIRRTSQRLLRGSTALRDEVRESTDANLLATLRVLGLLYGPIERQARIDHAFQKSRAYRLAPQVGWRHALGGITYFLLMVLIATGVLMAFYYRPSVQEAYPSVQHIVSSIPFGWLVRDVHAWAASLVVLMVALHLARTYVEAAYKAPRQTNWTLGMLLLLVVLGFGASGYLLNRFRLGRLVLAGERQGEAVAAGSLEGGFPVAHLILQAADRLVGVASQGGEPRAHEVEFPGVAHLPVRRLFQSVVDVGDALGAEGVGAQIVRRVVVIQSVGALQAVEKTGQAVRVEIGGGEDVEADAVGFALMLAGEIQLALQAGCLGGGDGSRADIGVRAGCQHGDGDGGKRGQVCLILLGEHARQVLLGDVGDFVRQHPGQFGFALRRLDQTRVYADVAAGQGKGVD